MQNEWVCWSHWKLLSRKEKISSSSLCLWHDLLDDQSSCLVSSWLRTKVFASTPLWVKVLPLPKCIQYDYSIFNSWSFEGVLVDFLILLLVGNSFCRCKSLWSWGKQLLSHAWSSSREFRMLCIFLLLVTIKYFHFWAVRFLVSGLKNHKFYYLDLLFIDWTIAGLSITLLIRIWESLTMDSDLFLPNVSQYMFYKKIIWSSQ